MKYLPYIACIGLVVYILLSQPEPEIIDRTSYFAAQVDSLELVNESYLQDIGKLDQIIAEKEIENDSLKNYQNLIYIYYAKEMESLNLANDSIVYSNFAELLK
jgi:hypothetical protein